MGIHDWVLRILENINVMNVRSEFLKFQCNMIIGELFSSLHRRLFVNIWTLFTAMNHFTHAHVFLLFLLVSIYILSTGVKPSTLMPLFNTCLAATYNANRATMRPFSDPDYLQVIVAT